MPIRLDITMESASANVGPLYPGEAWIELAGKPARVLGKGFALSASA